MNPSYLRSKILDLMQMNKPLLDVLPERILSDMPPLVKMAVSGVFSMIPMGITEAVMLKIKQMPDTELLKMWDYIDRIYKYCSTLPEVMKTDVISGEDIPKTGPEGNDLGDDRERQDHLRLMVNEAADRENTDRHTGHEG